jgi:hypothetical protein
MTTSVLLRLNILCIMFQMITFFIIKLLYVIAGIVLKCGNTWCFSMSFIFVLCMLHLLTVCALYVCLCDYVNMCMYLVLLCIFGKKLLRACVAEQRHTESFQDWIKLLKWLKTVFSSEMVRKVVPQSCSCKHELFFALFQVLMLLSYFMFAWYCFSMF